MAQAGPTLAVRMARATGQALSRVEVLALFPLMTLSAVWLGLGDVATVTVFLLPALLALRGLGLGAGGAALVGAGRGGVPGPRGGLAGRDALLAMLDRVAATPDHDTACILLQIDGWDGLTDRWGAEAAEDLALRCAERLATALRRDDVVARLGDSRFGVVLHPIPAARLGTREAITARLRAVLGEPVAIDGSAARLTVCAGHSALLRDAGPVPEATLAAAEAALAEAQRNGPNAVRAYAPGLLGQRRDRADLAAEVEDALAADEIRPWFQPQICTDTGVISGFEALARWHHPRRGVLAPADFLPAVEDAGRMDALGHRILVHALAALQAWDRAGLRVPSVSVNFSAGELRNPMLADQVAWELDRCELRPGRLTVEILETVAARGEDDAVIATLSALRAQGVNLDLDDFGIGQASLSAIRRFGVTRIKIDRSFVLGLDGDPEQRAMVAAILSMARHLGVETLAEGVETREVQALLAQMGCDHMQGFHIARPMPLDDTIAWATAHNERIAQPPVIGRRAG
ncbi:putative bifunctional diguanylate cyclase/phosphodiesterase [Roseicyclus persicicus]|uniref:EAL domain-containing protein n=1 Tax=Roseicyclus persicicus TaxID=2650661 RepID=A0A7X6JZN9_9RHOB|nr:GGDEF domain-containing phosphodiesterase [Roseibacterium persicicum]NKX45370.1 EAL domain-containing protein [Roseibacterium persicicum]